MHPQFGPRASLAWVKLLALGCLLAGGWAARSALADAGRAKRLTLEECIDVALANQPAIQAQQSALAAADEQRKVARSYFLPQIGLSTRLTHLDEHRSVEIPNPVSGALADVFADGGAFFNVARQAGSAAALAALDNPNVPLFPGGPSFNQISQSAAGSLPSSYKVDMLGESFATNQILLTQPLWTGGKIRHRHQQATLGVQAASADVAKSRQQTVFDVKGAYLAILLASELAKVAEDTEGQFRAIERLAQSLLDQGDEYVTTADAARARALRQLASGQRIRIARGRELAVAGLRRAMGLVDQPEIEIADDRLPNETEGVDWNELLERSLAQRPELTKAQVGVSVAELERKLAAAQFHPDVMLFGAFSTIHDNRNYMNPNDPEEWAVGLGVEMPLFAGGRRLAQSRRANREQDRARHVERLLREWITLELRQAYLEYVEASERMPMATEAVRAAKESLDRFRDQFVGDQIRDEDMPEYFEDLQQARILLTQAEIEYHQVLYARALARAKLQLASGTDVP